jgi:hypothetical protein
MHDRRLLRNLRKAIERLADTVADEAPVADALRRFADSVPVSRKDLALAVGPDDPTAIRGLLYEALDAGDIDARRFDWLMLARSRVAARMRRRRANRKPR